MKSRYHALESRSLLTGIQSARADEKRVLADLLHYLVEIDRRKVYLEWGYANLFAFLTEGLGYDKASAYRRFSAARALREMPEVEKKLTDGALTLSNLCQVQQVIRQIEKAAPVSIGEKRELLALVENKSQAQAERALMDARPAAMQAIHASRAHSDRPLPQAKREIKLVVAEELYEKWQKLQDLRSQADFDRSPEALLAWLLELGLDKADPVRREKRREERREKRATPAPVPVSGSAAKPTPPRGQAPKFPTLRDQVFKRDGARCAYVSPVTGRRCESAHALEIDHIAPRARGGSDEPGNLRDLCDSHNRRKSDASVASSGAWGVLPNANGETA